MVLAWGRVQYEKGFQVLARAMSTLRSRVPGVECIIAGRGSYLPELQSQVDIEGVSDIVRLIGFVPDEKLRSGVHRAGCVVIPSLYEPFGIVALEALAGGAPLIAARTGGLAELIDGTGAGMLFEPGNADELATCIEMVLTDPDLAQSMRERAAELLAARYSWAAIARATAAVYGGATPAETDDTLTPH
jgi:glycogen(starch) synthase